MPFNFRTGTAYVFNNSYIQRVCPVHEYVFYGVHVHMLIFFTASIVNILDSNIEQF